MINVTSRHKQEVTVANVTARPNVPVAIEDRKWKRFAKSPTGRTWLRLGLIEIEGAAPAQESDDEDDRKAIIEGLEAAGIEVDRRKSTDNLRSQLAALDE